MLKHCIILGNIFSHDKFLEEQHQDQVQCCLTSTETIRTIRDGEHRTTTSTFTHLLSSAQHPVSRNRDESSEDEACCPCGGVIKSSCTHNPLTQWNAFGNVQWRILGEPSTATTRSTTVCTLELLQMQQGLPLPHRPFHPSQALQHNLHCPALTFCSFSDGKVPSTTTEQTQVERNQQTRDLISAGNT